MWEALEPLIKPAMIVNAEDSHNLAGGKFAGSAFVNEAGDLRGGRGTRR